MSRESRVRIEKAQKAFRRQMILTLAEVAELIDSSIHTARRRLKDWQALTSYNQNGRFYTLPQVPVFNQHGLWRYKDISFSKYGNLKKTIIHLVMVSSAGLSGRELGDLVDLSPQSFMHHFSNCPGLCREKYNGVFVYFTDEPDIYERQRRQRQTDLCRIAVTAISDSEAVMILVAIISHHGISADDILALPKIKKSKLTLATIQGFMESHGLVKKTLISKH